MPNSNFWDVLTHIREICKLAGVPQNSGNRLSKTEYEILKFQLKFNVPVGFNLQKC